jgi:hypothetical protein
MFASLTIEPKFTEYESTSSIRHLACKAHSDTTPMNSHVALLSYIEARSKSPLASPTNSHTSVMSPIPNLKGKTMVLEVQ